MRIINSVFLKFFWLQLLLLQLILYIVPFNDTKIKLRHTLLKNEFSNRCLIVLFILVGLYIIYIHTHLLTWFVTTMPLFTSTFPWFSSHLHHLQIYFCNKSTFPSYIKIVRQSKCEQRSILFFVKLIHVEREIAFFLIVAYVAYIRLFPSFFLSIYLYYIYISLCD